MRAVATHPDAFRDHVYVGPDHLIRAVDTPTVSVDNHAAWNEGYQRDGRRRAVFRCGR